MSSLPTAWLAVGCILLLLAVVMTILFLLKSREVTTLKKQCEDLRETMRMMRYEEANLSRMLHTAGKKANDLEEEPTTEALEEEPVMKALEGLEEEEYPEEEEPTDEPSPEVPESQEEEDTPENPELQEEKESQETPETLEEQEDSKPLEEQESMDSQESTECEEPIENQEFMEDQAPLEDSEPQEKPNDSEDPLEEYLEEAPTQPAPQKSPINERKPAIPTDLFAMWFAENEATYQEPEPEAKAMQEIPVDEVSAPKQPTEVIAGEAYPSSITADTIAEEPIAELAQEQVTEEIVEKESIEQAAETLAATLHEPHTTEEPSAEALTAGVQPPVELSKEDERFCRKLERIVNARLRNPNLNIDIIAAQFGIGRTNFYRKVRELMGMSPNDYLRKCRMERAVELLANPELTIGEVCAQVGMPDAQYFSRVFKVYYGMSPSAYREHINQ